MTLVLRRILCVVLFASCVCWLASQRTVTAAPPPAGIMLAPFEDEADDDIPQEYDPSFAQPVDPGDGPPSAAATNGISHAPPASGINAAPPAGITLAPFEDQADDDIPQEFDPSFAQPNPNGPPSPSFAVRTLEQMQEFQQTHPGQPAVVKPNMRRSHSAANNSDPIDTPATDSIGHVPPPSDINAPPLSTNFIGDIDANQFIPPDTTGAVGPGAGAAGRVFEMLNQGRTIYDKTGAVVAGTINLTSFWSPLAGSISDPRVLWDHYTNRWIVSGLGLDASPNRKVLIGVSQTTDPAGAYNLYSIPVNVNNGFDHSASFLDFDNTGFDPNNVVLTGNVFTDGGSFVHADVYIINKARLIAGGGALIYNTDFTIVHNPCSSVNGTNINFAPCITYGQTSASAVNYIIDNGWYDSGNLAVRFFRVSQITGTGAAAVLDCLGDNNFVQTTGCYNFSVLGAAQFNCTRRIDAGDYRISSPGTVRNGKIWFAHTAGAPVAGCPDPATAPAATKAEVYWYEVDPANIVVPGLPDQANRVTDAVQAYYYPSIAVNKDDCVMMGFTGSGTNAGQFAAGLYTARQITDAANTMQAVSVEKAGEDQYFKTFGALTARNRWGDYSRTTVDPTDDQTLWTLQEYARPHVGATTCPNTNNTGRFGTWWGSMGCPAVTQVPPCGLCGPGAHFVDNCLAGSDSLSSGAVVGLDITLDCLRDNNLVLTGPVLIHRTNALDDSNHYPGTRPVDAHNDVIDTEMIAMTLTGGGATLRAGAFVTGTLQPLGRSFGTIAEQTTDPTLADSFFDVFFEVDPGGGNPRLYNQTPVRVSATITCIPPYQTYHHPVGLCLPLYTSPTPGQGTVLANLVSANHSPYARGACCYPDGSCQPTNLTDCQQTGGNYLGDGSTCSPNPCPQPTVACCFPNGSCLDLTPSNCSGSGGLPQAPGTTCSTFVCPQPTCTCFGDINGDGQLDGKDVQAFVQCAIGGGGPGLNCTCANMNHTGGVDDADIPGFVQALLTKGCGP